jgi:hypothetical protein
LNNWAHKRAKLNSFYCIKIHVGYTQTSIILILEAIMSSWDTVKFRDNNGHMKFGDWKTKKLLKAFEQLFP